MLRHEFKKLFSKNFGVCAVLFVIICELVFLNFAYRQQSFSNNIDRTYYEEYMREFSGKLTSENEQKILAEQEKILDAYNAEQMVMRRLSNGEFSTQAEFNAEIEKTSAITERKAAFELLLSKYEYAVEDRENRYIVGSDYSGFAADYPDIFMLTLVIVMTATLFLNEESSNVITYIRIYKGGKSRTLRAKLLSLLILIVSVQLFRTVAELLLMGIRGSFEELLFPIQSIEFFGTSEYSISILCAFFAVSAIRLLGYFFVSSLIILLSVSLKKPLFTVFIPCVVCLLQQFIFTPATPAYYIPTGLLRGVGYFRGSDSENSADVSPFAPIVKRFIAIPKEYLAMIVILSVIFIFIAIAVAARYYNGKSDQRHIKPSMISLIIASIAFLSGCSGNNRRNIVFNAGESTTLVQNSDFFCYSDANGITLVSKKDGTQQQIIFDPFYNGQYNIVAAMCGDELYYYNKPFGIDDYAIYKISLNTLYQSVVNAPRDNSSSGVNYTGGFLGLSLDSNNTIVGVIHSIFTDGSRVYLTYDEGGVYVLNNGVPECIISERLYDENQICFDGRRIFYINKKMELKSYDVDLRQTEYIAGDFTTAVYCDEKKVIYSNSKGIFAFDSIDKSNENLSSKSAEAISSDGENIVYSCDGMLFLIGNTEPICEYYIGEGFAVISGENKVAVKSGDEFEFINLPD